MTIFTMTTDGTDVQPRTFTKDMNWSPYIAPDGRHLTYTVGATNAERERR